MLNIPKMLKPWKESGALNAQVSLYGFWSETVTLTKSGDLLMVLSLPGVDYDSLDANEQQYAVKRLESALKMFGPGFHIYQYLFKSNRPEIPFASYGDDVIDAAIDQRIQFVARIRGIKAKEGESAAKLLTAHLRKAEENILGRLIVEVAIMLSARAQPDGGKVLRNAAQTYNVNTDAVALKVKQEFAAKAKAKLSQKIEARPAATTKKTA